MSSDYDYPIGGCEGSNCKNGIECDLCSARKVTAAIELK